MAVAVALAASLPGAIASAGPAPGSALVDCSHASTRVVVTVSSHLDPSCTYTAGVDITASHVTLDCAGATIAAATSAPGSGIQISTPAGSPLTDVHVAHCHVSGFGNSLRVTRDGWRANPVGHEFDHPTSDISITDSTFTRSNGVGIYVDGEVSGVTIARNTITQAGSSGVYLEAGSKQNQVTDNEITDNGFVETGPRGQEVTVGSTKLWMWGVGREGISVDGSFDNTISGNRFAGNSAGAILLYENCDEDVGSPSYFERRTGADHNLIEGNTFDGGRNGVWVGSRMAENTLPMDCGKPAYVDGAAQRVVLDHAAHNTIRGNAFHDVTYAIRVEDDHTTVVGNTFSGSTADHHAVIVGTPLRASVLHRPVVGTVLRHNVSTIVDNPNPYRWIPGESGTVMDGNLALGRTVGICQAPPLWRSTFIFVIALAGDDGSGVKPPTPDLTLPTIGALPACPTKAAPTPTTTGVPASGSASPGSATPATPLPGSATFTG